MATIAEIKADQERRLGWLINKLCEGGSNGCMHLCEEGYTTCMCCIRGVCERAPQYMISEFNQLMNAKATGATP